MFQVRQNGRDQRLDELCLIQPCQEAQRHSPYVLVRVLQVIPQVLADQNHLRQDLTPRIRLVDDLQIQQQQLLHGVILRWQNVAHNCNEKRRQRLTIQQQHHCLLHRINLPLSIMALKLLLNLVCQRRCSLVEINQQGTRLLHLLLLLPSLPSPAKTKV